MNGRKDAMLAGNEVLDSKSPCDHYIRYVVGILTHMLWKLPSDNIKFNVFHNQAINLIFKTFVLKHNMEILCHKPVTYSVRCNLIACHNLFRITDLFPLL